VLGFDEETTMKKYILAAALAVGGMFGTANKADAQVIVTGGSYYPGGWGLYSPSYYPYSGFSLGLNYGVYPASYGYGGYGGGYPGYYTGYSGYGYRPYYAGYGGYGGYRGGWGGYHRGWRRW